MRNARNARNETRRSNIITKTQEEVAKTIIFPSSLANKITVTYGSNGLVIRNKDNRASVRQR